MSCRNLRGVSFKSFLWSKIQIGCTLNSLKIMFSHWITTIITYCLVEIWEVLASRAMIIDTDWIHIKILFYTYSWSGKITILFFTLSLSGITIIIQYIFVIWKVLALKAWYDLKYTLITHCMHITYQNHFFHIELNWHYHYNPLKSEKW